MKLPPALAQRWNSLQPREKNLVRLTSVLVCVALLWWVAIAPALQTLRSTQVRHQQIDAQLQQIRRLQAQAAQLQSQPKIGFDESQRALEASVKQRLGTSAQLNVVGERATVTLKNTSADALAQWLTQVRTNARALPVEARLTRTPATANSTPAYWDGSVVLALPAR